MKTERFPLILGHCNTFVNCLIKDVVGYILWTQCGIFSIEQPCCVNWNMSLPSQDLLMVYQSKLKGSPNCYHGSKMHMIGSLVASQTFPPPIPCGHCPSLNAAFLAFAWTPQACCFWALCPESVLLIFLFIQGSAPTSPPRGGFFLSSSVFTPCHTLYFFMTLLRLLVKLHLFVCCCFTNLKLISTRRGMWGISLTIILSISNSGMNHSSHKKVHFLIPLNTIIQYKQVYILLKTVLFHCLVMWHHN